MLKKYNLATKLTRTEDYVIINLILKYKMIIKKF